VPEEEVDRDVRLHIYRRFLDRGRPPSVGETAVALGLAPVDVEEAYRRLAEGHVIVLKSGTLDIWMANPLSAEPTAFRAVAGDRWWWGNCAWDAPGILAMLHEDGSIETSCPDCDEPLTMTIREGELEPLDAVAHFAVPAAGWWDDIGYT
jgi:hypothetical protein